MMMISCNSMMILMVCEVFLLSWFDSFGVNYSIKVVTFLYLFVNSLFKLLDLLGLVLINIKYQKFCHFLRKMLQEIVVVPGRSMLSDVDCLRVHFGSFKKYFIISIFLNYFQELNSVWEFVLKIFSYFQFFLKAIYKQVFFFEINFLKIVFFSIS